MSTSITGAVHPVRDASVGFPHPALLRLIIVRKDVGDALSPLYCQAVTLQGCATYSGEPLRGVYRWTVITSAKDERVATAEFASAEQAQPGVI